MAVSAFGVALGAKHAAFAALRNITFTGRTPPRAAGHPTDFRLAH